jgi:hypothetical protein
MLAVGKPSNLPKWAHDTTQSRQNWETMARQRPLASARVLLPARRPESARVAFELTQLSGGICRIGQARVKRRRDET